MILDGNSFLRHNINGGVLHRSILGSILFLLYTKYFPEQYWGIAINTNDSNLYSKYDSASDL